MAALHAAPMAGISDRHYRMLMRCVSPHVVVWSEMTWDNKILEAEETGNLEAVLGFSEEERPVVLQLGGSDPQMLAKAAKLVAARGYDEINLNCGCPAGTGGEVRSCYGARLMLDPARVAACCSAIRTAVGPSVPVTVKCRLGVDGRETYDDLIEFIRTVSVHGGIEHFVVHARHAMLSLNASRNRTVPPLRYDWVSQLQADFPHLRFTINGGLLDESHACEMLRDRKLGGAMLGRRAKEDPFLFARADRLLRERAPSSMPCDGDVSDGTSDEGDGDGRPAAGYGDERGSGDGGKKGGETGGETSGGTDGQYAEDRTRGQVLERYCSYAKLAQAANWGRGHPETLCRALLAPLGGLFYDTSCGPRWRRVLNEVVQDRARLRDSPVTEIVRHCVEVSGVGASGLLEAPPELGVAAKRRERERSAGRELTARGETSGSTAAAVLGASCTSSNFAPADVPAPAAVAMACVL